MTPAIIAINSDLAKNSCMTLKKISILLLIPVLFTTQSSVAANTPKAGQTCKKVGQIQNIGSSKLICVSKNGKKNWAKYQDKKASSSASPAASASPEPLPTSTPAIFAPIQPWATDFTRDQLVQSAISAMNSKKLSSTITPYEITYQEGIFPEDKILIEKLFKETFSLFGSSNSNKIQILVGFTDEWAVKAAIAKSLFLITPLYPCGSEHPNWDAACAEPGQVIIILNQSYATRSSGVTPLRIGEQSFAPHESFHTFQGALAGKMSGIPPTNPMFIPRWLTEGSANFIGYYMQERVGIRTYEEGRTFQVDNNGAYFDGRGLLPLKNYEVPSLSNVYLDPYGIGQAATEYLVASAGADVILKIFEFTGSENSFESGFKRATGISLADFYEKFEIARKNMRIGRH